MSRFDKRMRFAPTNGRSVNCCMNHRRGVKRLAEDETAPKAAKLVTHTSMARSCAKCIHHDLLLP
jgi:hypothetical protein